MSSNLNIKTLLILLGTLASIALFLLILAIFDLVKESQELKSIEYNRFLMFEKADELRQSSDELTRYARTYANTGDSQYKDIYFRILDIRNGFAKRPADYSSIYWDISEPTRSQRHPLGQSSSLKSEMKKLPYLPYEFEKLEESELNSNELVQLEVEAFNAMDGLFKDSNGDYTIKGASDQQLAIKLLTSEQYHQAKEKIMLPLDDFLRSLADRTSESISNQNVLIDLAFRKIFVFFFFSLAVLILTLVIIKKRILSPIKYLTEVISIFKNNNSVANEKIYFNDEVGFMTKQFFEMKRHLDDDQKDLNSALQSTRQAYADVEAEKKRFEAMFENAPIPYAINNDKQEITYLNREFTKIFGYTIKDIPTLKDWWVKAYPDPDYQRYIQDLWTSHMEKTVSGNDFEPLEANIRTKSGTTKTVLISAASLGDSISKDHLVMLYDITSRKLAEKQLKLSGRVFSDTHDGILITDANKIIIDVNPAFCDITGYSREEVISRNPNFLSSKKQGPKFYADMWQDIDIHGHWQGEIWNRKKDGELYAELLTISALFDEHKEVVNYVGIFSDITKNKEQQEKLQLMAHYDVLTGLPNRTLFKDRFQQAIAHSKRTKTLLVVCFLDLDNFKLVNDNFGHDSGDQLLIEVSKRLRASIREEDTVSRQGGDEFTILLSDIEDFAQCDQRLERVRQAVSQPYEMGNYSHQLTVSIGATIYPLDDADIDTLIRHADQAMYLAKISGKDQRRLFSISEKEQTIDKHKKLQEIKLAISNKEFCLYYQPKVNMKTGKVFGAEALIRWIHPEKGLIPPLDFLPLIDGTNVETDIGGWVINEAISQLDRWQQQDLKLEISINISSNHLQSPSFFIQLNGAFEQHPSVDSKNLQLEILESSALGDINAISHIIKTCQDKWGIDVALDDFGTGYSSLTHMKELPTSTIKVDQSFVRDMLDDPNDSAIIEGIIGLADTFDREVIAEGVETTQHGLMLLSMGCEEAQGYTIAKPMPADEFSDWLNNYTPNRTWQTCSNKIHSIKEKKRSLFKITSERWKELFISNLQSDPNVHQWPIESIDHCHCGLWIKRAGQEHLFDRKGLELLIKAHEEVHALANRLYSEYQNGNIEKAQAGLEELQEIHEKMLNVLALCN